MEMFCTILFWLGFAFTVIGGIMFMVAAFRVGVGWGLAIIFLGPIASIIFLCTHFAEAKKGFLFQVLGAIVMFTGGFIAASAGAAQSGLTVAMMKAVTRHGPPQPAGQNEQHNVEQPIADAPDAGPIAPAPAEPKIEPWIGDDFTGKTYKEVVAALGEPRITYKTGGITYWTYPHRGLELVSKDGVHVMRQQSSTIDPAATR